MKNKIASIILVIALVIGGVGMIASGIGSSGTELKDVTTLTAYSMDDSFDYEIKEAYIFDNYATYEEDNEPQTYYLAVSFFDTNGKLCLTSMEMEKGDDLYDEVMDYLADDTMYMGDLILPVYASANSLSSSSEVGQYFQKFATDFEKHSLFPELLWLQLDYKGSTMEDYEDQTGFESIGSFVMGAVFLLLSVVVTLLSIRASRKASTPTDTPNAPQDTFTPEHSQYHGPSQFRDGQPTVFCPACGQAVNPGTAFCGSCGAKLQ